MVIPGFTSYDIKENGEVTKVATGEVVKPYNVNSNSFYKYVRVSLVGDDGKRHSCNVIRLLAITYLGTPEEACLARAIDGNPLNAVLSNVTWEPYSRITKKSWDNGAYAKRKRKANNCCNEASIEMVLNALEQLSDPVTNAELSELLGVPYSTARYTTKYLLCIGKVKCIYGRGYILA